MFFFFCLVLFVSVTVLCADFTLSVCVCVCVCLCVCVFVCEGGDCLFYSSFSWRSSFSSHCFGMLGNCFMLRKFCDECMFDSVPFRLFFDSALLFCPFTHQAISFWFWELHLIICAVLCFILKWSFLFVNIDIDYVSWAVVVCLLCLSQYLNIKSAPDGMWVHFTCGFAGLDEDVYKCVKNTFYSCCLNMHMHVWQKKHKHTYNYIDTALTRLHIEGSWPEWCISSMIYIYSRDTPFWLETLDMQRLEWNTSSTV